MPTSNLTNKPLNGGAAKLPVSVFIVCFNEESNIRRALESCSDMAEIVVVDSGSTDQTVEIVKEYTDKVFFNDWPGYAKQKAFAMSLCEHEWVLNLDADEELLAPLVSRFSEIIKQGKYTSVRCSRNDIFIGKLHARFTRKSNHCRFYAKSKAMFDCNRLVHESADVEGEQLVIKETFNHYGDGAIELNITKSNGYSSLKAEEKFLKGRLFSIFKLVSIFPLIFIKAYFLHGYLFSGIRGLILSVNSAHYAFLKEAKLYEHWEKKKLNDQ